MPTKYTERLNLPIDGLDDIKFSTSIGLKVATGYERVVFNGKTPCIEFSESQMNKINIYVPDGQKWRINSATSPYVEYRSKDYCNVKIMMWKKPGTLKAGMFYASPFDLRSDQIPVLIEPLYRKRTLSNQDVFCS